MPGGPDSKLGGSTGAHKTETRDRGRCPKPETKTSLTGMLEEFTPSWEEDSSGIMTSSGQPGKICKVC